MNLRIDFLLLVLDKSLLFLLHLDFLLILHVNRLTLETVLVLPHFRLMRAPLNRILLLRETPELLLSRVKIRLLSRQVGAMLRVLGHEA